MKDNLSRYGSVRGSMHSIHTGGGGGGGVGSRQSIPYNYDEVQTHNSGRADNYK